MPDTTATDRSSPESPLATPPNWEGYSERECGDHRTTGGRAWCFSDGEWCYESMPCRGCELPMLRAKNERMARALAVAHSAVGILYEKAIGDEVRAVIQTALDIIAEANDAGAHDATSEDASHD